MCAMCCVDNIHCKVHIENRNTKVRKLNLRGSRKRTNGVVWDVEVY